jgi:acyl-ACP thioesterase
LKELPPLEAVGEWTVRHSSVDFNRHLNNTVYADLLCDFLPAAVRERPPKAYALQYVTEAREGDTLTLYYGVEGNDHFVEARVGDTRIFVGRITV